MAKNPRLPGFDSPAPPKRGRGAGCKWRCHACGEIQKYWAAAQRHADENRHYRIEVVFSQIGEAA